MPGHQAGGEAFRVSQGKREPALEAGCKIHLIKIARQVEQVNQACEDDITSLCASAGDKKAEVMQCLQSNEAKLTPDCKSSLAGAMGN